MTEENDLGLVEENNPVENETFKDAEDNDEKILIDLCKNKKYEVTTSELISAGFNSLRMRTYEFTIGQFVLSRLDINNPFIIEKI